MFGQLVILWHHYGENVRVGMDKNKFWGENNFVSWST